MSKLAVTSNVVDCTVVTPIAATLMATETGLIPMIQGRILGETPRSGS